MRRSASARVARRQSSPSATPAGVFRLSARPGPAHDVAGRLGGEMTRRAAQARVDTPRARANARSCSSASARSLRCGPEGTSAGSAPKKRGRDGEGRPGTSVKLSDEIDAPRGASRTRAVASGAPEDADVVLLGSRRKPPKVSSWRRTSSSFTTLTALARYARERRLHPARGAAARAARCMSLNATPRAAARYVVPVPALVVARAGTAPPDAARARAPATKAAAARAIARAPSWTCAWIDRGAAALSTAAATAPCGSFAGEVNEPHGAHRPR